MPGRARKLIAVDFDSRHLRIVEAALTNGRVRIRKLTQVDMPEGMDIEDPRAVGEFLGRTLKGLHLAGTSVVMNVPRGQAVLKPVVLPPGVEKDELAGMVRFQVEKELPFDVSEAVIDFTVTSHYDAPAGQEAAAAGLNVLAAVVKAPVVDHYRKIAEAANIKLLRLGLRPYAIMRCVDACVPRGEDEVSAIAFLTADETEIMVLVGHSLTFSRSAMVSISPPRAGSDPAAKETVESLVNEIARSVQSYQTVKGGDGKIDKVQLAGGTGMESRLAGEITRRIKVGCETLDPSVALGLLEATPGTSAFAAAIGLAVAQGDSALPFDFLAPKRPRVKRDMRKIRVAAVLMLVVSVLGGGVFAGYTHLDGKRQQVAALKRRQIKAKKNNKAFKSLSHYVKAVDGWEDGGRDWLDHWAYLCGQFPPCQDIYIDALRTNRNDGSISFTAKAVERAGIDKLTDNLTKAKYPHILLASRLDTNDAYQQSTDVKIIVPNGEKVDLSTVKVEPRPGDDISLEKFNPGKKLAPGSATASRASSKSSPTPAAPTPPARSSRTPYRRPSSTSQTPSAAASTGETPTPQRPADLGEQEAKWRKAFESRLPRYWERDLEEKTRTLGREPTEAEVAGWRREFEERMERYWPAYLESRRKETEGRNSPSSNDKHRSSSSNDKHRPSSNDRSSRKGSKGGRR